MEERRQEVRNSLIEQLILKGMDSAVFVDLADKYMEFWDIVQALNEFIGEHGATYQERTSSGNLVTKNNPAMKDLIGANRQMLAILNQLKIKPGNIAQPTMEGDTL